jgi:hypothetical protein
MNFLVERQLASLSEGPVTPFKHTFKRFLSCMNVSVLFQILAKGELLEANNTGVLSFGLVGGKVSAERESRCEFLVTDIDFAFIWSFHFGLC